MSQLHGPQVEPYLGPAPWHALHATVDLIINMYSMDDLQIASEGLMCGCS